MAEPKFIRDNGCKEAVCVDAGRVYDSCCEEYPTSAKSAILFAVTHMLLLSRISSRNSSGKSSAVFV